jgi:hypothetical protein
MFKVEKKKDKMMEQLLKDEDDDKSIWDSISRYSQTFIPSLLLDLHIDRGISDVIYSETFQNWSLRKPALPEYLPIF